MRAEGAPSGVQVATVMALGSLGSVRVASANQVANRAKGSSAGGMPRASSWGRGVSGMGSPLGRAHDGLDGTET